MRASQTLTLTLYRQIPRLAQYDYIGLPTCRMERIKSGPPTMAFRILAKRTRRWTIGQVHTDARTLQLPADTPPGDCPIEFGAYGGPEGDWLMIRSADGHRSDERLTLTQIRVTPPENLSARRAVKKNRASHFREALHIRRVQVSANN